MPATRGEYDPTWVYDPTNPERSHRGAALCRQALARGRHGEPAPLDPDDPVRDAALRRVRAERAPRARAATQATGGRS